MSRHKDISDYLLPAIIVLFLVWFVLEVMVTASSADFSPDCTYRDAESLRMRNDC